MSPQTMLSAFVVVVVAFGGAVDGLKCHLILSGSLTDQNAITTSTSLQECPIGANSCVKISDFTRNVFSKQCQVGNCTTQTGQTQAPANCFNSTSGSSLMSTCCCYGDGCNASPTMLPLASSILAVVTSAFLLS